jgi:hypothetical protein
VAKKEPKGASTGEHYDEVVHAVVKDGKIVGDTKAHRCIGSSCQEPVK